MARLIYRFGDCTVDPAARELRRAGELRILSPKVFDCLAYLIEHRDRAVGRDELIAAVWGRLDVTDALLGQAVLKARRAVADSGDEQNAIRTIPRFGYRWVAEIGVEELPDLQRSVVSEARPSASVVETVEVDEPDAEAAQTEHPRDTKLARNRGRPWLIGAALVAALVLIGYLLDRRAVLSPSVTENSARKAADVTLVLPVAVDADPEWSWLRLGMMDLVAARLRRAGMTVVPSDNVVALLRTAGADTNAALESVRTATGAHRVVVPSATRTAAGWRVHFDVRAASGDIEIEARDADAVIAARAAAKQLLARLGMPSADEGAEPPSLATILQHAEAALLTDDLDSARRIIENAPAALRDSPELRLRLAQVDLRGGRIAAARQRLDALLAEVSAEADPVLRARALTASGVAAIHSGDIAAALRTCAEATALLANRNEPAALGRAYTGCGVAHGSAGRFDAAAADFAQARIALEIASDALSLARVESNEGMLETIRGRYADAVATMLRAEERFRRFGAHYEVVMTISDQVDAQLALLQPVEALANSERGRAELPHIENADARRGLQIQHARALGANGHVDEAAVLLKAVADEATPGQESSLLGQARASQARLELDGGQLEVAIAHAREAVAALAKPDDARERAMAWLTLVRALRTATQDAEAAAESQRFSAWAATSMVAAAPVYAALAEAESLAATLPADAAASYESALHASEAAGVPADIVAVAVSWSGALIERGELERAGSVVGRIARWAATDFAASVAQARLYRALGQDDAWRAALQHARTLAGQRPIPAALLQPARSVEIR